MPDGTEASRRVTVAAMKSHAAKLNLSEIITVLQALQENPNITERAPKAPSILDALKSLHAGSVVTFSQFLRYNYAAILVVFPNKSRRWYTTASTVPNTLTDEQFADTLICAYHVSISTAHLPIEDYMKTMVTE